MCRHYRLEAELLAEVNWRVRWDDVRFGDTADGRKAFALEHNGSRPSRVRELCVCISLNLSTLLDSSYWRRSVGLIMDI